MSVKFKQIKTKRGESIKCFIVSDLFPLTFLSPKGDGSSLQMRHILTQTLTGPRDKDEKGLGQDKGGSVPQARAQTKLEFQLAFGQAAIKICLPC